MTLYITLLDTGSQLPWLGARSCCGVTFVPASIYDESMWTPPKPQHLDPVIFISV